MRKITPDGSVTTLAGSSPGNANGTGGTARFAHPSGVAVDAAGNVYVADYYNPMIRKITPEGVVGTLAGSERVLGSTNGIGSAARFNSPEGVAVDRAGIVYVADAHNNLIRMITPNGEVSTLAGLTGIPGSLNGPGSAARFSNPTGVAVDASGNVFVADWGAHTIRKITPGGTVSTLAGRSSASGRVDGPGSVARFSSPHSLAVDGTGNVYVADTRNSLIRRINPAGVAYAIGGVAGRSGSADGPGGTAQFRFPYGVAVDAVGNIYVADSMNNTIRKGVPVLGPVAPGAPRLRGAQMVAGQIKFQFTSTPGLNYTFLHKTRLDEPVWSVVETLAGTGATIEITRPASPQASGFFQLRAE